MNLLQAARNILQLDSELKENGEFFLVENGIKRKPTDEEMTALNDEVLRMKAEAKANEWQVKRRAEYQLKNPFEQIEMMADGTFNDWYQSIKEKYPKNA